MRYSEIASAIRIPVSIEEQNILDLAHDGVLKTEDLDERQNEVARLMVSRGILNRYKNGTLVVNSLAKIKRD